MYERSGLLSFFVDRRSSFELVWFSPSSMANGGIFLQNDSCKKCPALLILVILSFDGGWWWKVVGRWLFHLVIAQGGGNMILAAGQRRRNCWREQVDGVDTSLAQLRL